MNCSGPQQLASGRESRLQARGSPNPGSFHSRSFWDAVGQAVPGHALTVTDNRGYQAAGARASSPSWCHLITWGRQEPYFRNIHMYIYICIVGLKPLASFSAFSFGDSFVLSARQACSLDPMSDRKLWTPGLESPEHVTRGNLRMSFKHR